MTRPMLRASAAFVLAAGTLAGSLALVGCDDSKDWKTVKRESGDAWDAAKAWTVARREDAERFYAKSVADFPGEFADAKAKAKAAGGDAAKALDVKWDDVSRKLTEMKAASADKWAEARDAFIKSYESLKRDVASKK